MKKFYTLIAAAATAASLAASAAVPEHSVSLASLAEGKAPRITTTAGTSQQLKKAPAKAGSVEWTEWQAAGTGTLTMDDGLELFLGIEGYTGDRAGVAVEMRTDKADMSLHQYKFVDMFGDIDIIVDYDAGTGLLRVPMQKTGIQSDFGELLVMDAATAFEEIWGNDPSHSAEEIAAMVEMYAPYNYFVEGLGRFYIYLGYTADGIGDLLALSDIKLQLDGGIDYVPTIGLDTYIPRTGADKGTLTISEGVESVRYGIFPGSLNQWMINKVLDGGEGITTLKESGEFTIPDIEANVAHTMVAVTFEKGKAMEWAYRHFSLIDDEAEAWTSLGKGKVVTDILEMVWETQPHNLEAEVQQSKANPGLYRVVNLHKSTHPLVDYSQCKSHNTYLIIDATDPEFVLLRPHDLGIDQGGGAFILESQAQIKINTGSLPGSVKALGGKLKDGVITFPAESFTLYCDNWEKFGGENGALYLTNLSGKTSVTLPTDGVSSIEADSNAPVRYYNLQGIEIARPEAGQAVISVQGSKVRKTMLK